MFDLPESDDRALFEDLEGEVERLWLMRATRRHAKANQDDSAESAGPEREQAAREGGKMFSRYVRQLRKVRRNSPECVQHVKVSKRESEILAAAQDIDRWRRCFFEWPAFCFGFRRGSGWRPALPFNVLVESERLNFALGRGERRLGHDTGCGRAAHREHIRGEESAGGRAIGFAEG